MSASVSSAIQDVARSCSCVSSASEEVIGTMRVIVRRFVSSCRQEVGSSSEEVIGNNSIRDLEKLALGAEIEELKSQILVAKAKQQSLDEINECLPRRPRRPRRRWNPWSRRRPRP